MWCDVIRLPRSYTATCISGLFVHFQWTIWNIAIYCNMHHITMYRDISYCDPCIAMRIVSWSPCQKPSWKHTKTSKRQTDKNITEVIRSKEKQGQLLYWVKSQRTEHLAEFTQGFFFLFNNMSSSEIFISSRDDNKNGELQDITEREKKRE